MKNAPKLMLIGSLALLAAGCNNDDEDARRNAPSTFSAYVADQACTKTSETGTPVDANSLNLPDPEDPLDANAVCG